MVSHRGATRRKQVPQPAAPEEPPLVANCICCHCNAVFQPLEVTGLYLNRHCPSCGETLAEDGYDTAYVTASEEMARVEREIPLAEAEEEKWNAWAARFRWPPFKPIRRLFGKKAEKAQNRKNNLELKHLTLRRRFSVLARSRYYTGEWFQRTRIPLERTVVAPYRIGVCYGRDGAWHINQTDRRTSGIIAEHRVFQELLARVRDPGSAIFDAQIVPNIYLPHEQGGRKAEKLWSQIDCLLLTRQAAFVIEVKRRRKRIVAPSPFEEIWSTSSGELVAAYAEGKIRDSPKKAGFEDESFALRQNSEHAVAFDDACPDYPFERIYEQVVYVGTDSFSTDLREFADNVNVCHLGRGKPDFADVIEAQCMELDDIIDQASLERLGESFVKTYGDLNQKRGQLHAQRIARMHGK